MMDLLLSTFNSTLAQALWIGSIVGAIAGIVTFAATSASERTHYIVVGVLGGGLLMGVYQGLQLSSYWGWDLFSGATTGSAASLLWTSLIRMAAAALIGGLLMLLFLAPGRAILGALGGVVVGIIASVLLWFTLDAIGQSIPVLLYGFAVLAVMLLIFESISRA